MNTLSVRETLSFAWETFKKRPWVLIGGYLLAMIVSITFSLILDTAGMDPFSPVTFIMNIVNVVIGLLVEIGIVTFALHAHDNIKALSVRDLWNPRPFWRYLAGQILVGIVVLIGLVLLIVPGIIAAIALFATSYLIVDRGLGPIQAMKESYRITKGHWLELFLLVLAVFALNVIGFLAVLVGLILTIPITMLAMVHAYRVLEGRSNERHIRQAEDSIAIS